MEIKISCPQCGQHIVLENRSSVLSIACPSCHANIGISTAAKTAASPLITWIFGVAGLLIGCLCVWLAVGLTKKNGKPAQPPDAAASNPVASSKPAPAKADPSTSSKPLAAWVEQLGNPGRSARDEARAALRQLGAAALPELTRISTDAKADRKQRSNAIDAIGYAGTKDGPEVQVLIAALKDKQSVVRAAALTSLGNLQVDPTILVPICIAMLDDSNNGVRRRASVDLGGMAEAAISAVPALQKATKDENETVRAAAVEALKKIVPEPIQHVVRENHSPFHLDGNHDPLRENGIGMKFKHIASMTNGTGTGVLFASIWKTRIGDFDKFVTATGYDASEGVFTYGTNSWQNRGNTWKNPGWEVTPEHPVCGINWFDAVKFCEWLTDSERKASKIGPRDEYRLPSDDEWSLMVGEATFPWGETWPPPPGAGNYMDDSETKIFPRDHGVKGYHDGFPITSPVGSFKANPLGLYDVGGNLWEWCSDLYQKVESPAPDQSSQTKPETNSDPGKAMFRILRGAAWHTSSRSEMASDHRRGFHPAVRNDLYGFRCVLVVEE